MHLRELAPALRALQQQNRLREPDDSLLRATLSSEWGADFVDAARNDYLGLASVGPSDVSRETSPAPGAGASRLIFGTSPEHLDVEALTSDWTGLEAGLLFASGYAANVGALSCLLSPDDAVFSDRLNHASLIDGIRLSRARPRVFDHLDLDELHAALARASEAPARWVIVEAYYSMDGDGPDLARLRAICDEHDAHLYVDEAHSIGVFGASGAGRCREAGIRPDLLMVAFGKAVGSQGACVLGSRDVRSWLWNRARSFVFSTAPSPAHTARLRRQIELTRAADEQRSRLARVAARVRGALVERGAPLIPGSFGPVLGLLCGGEDCALELAERLRSQGVLAQAIRPPTVPPDASRVRLVLSAGFTDAQADRLAQIVARETCPQESDA